MAYLKPHSFYASDFNETHCILAIHSRQGYVVVAINEGIVGLVALHVEVDEAVAWIKHLMFVARENGHNLRVEVDRLKINGR